MSYFKTRPTSKRWRGISRFFIHRSTVSMVAALRQALLDEIYTLKPSVGIRKGNACAFDSDKEQIFIGQAYLNSVMADNGWPAALLRVPMSAMASGCV